MNFPNFFPDFDFTNSGLLRAVGMALAHNVWQAGAIALGLAGALRVIPAERARARYGAACAAMVATTAAFLFTAAYLASQRGTPATEEPTRAEVAATMAREFPEWNIVLAAPSVTATPATGTSGGMAGTMEWLTPTVAAAWMGCVCVIVAWNAVGLARVGSWSRGGLPENGPATAMVTRLSGKMGLARIPRVLLNAHVGVPAVVGHFRPAILLPLALVGELTPAHLEAILAHELAHVRRWDYLANLLQTIAETLFFHHPAVRWMSTATRREREHCCDDLAAETIGSPATYARALGHLEALRAEETTMLMPASNTTKLLPRIRRVLGLPATPTADDRRRERLASVVVVAAMVVPLVTACVVDRREMTTAAATPAATPAVAAGTETPSMPVPPRGKTDNTTKGARVIAPRTTTGRSMASSSGSIWSTAPGTPFGTTTANGYTLFAPSTPMAMGKGQQTWAAPGSTTRPLVIKGENGTFYVSPGDEKAMADAEKALAEAEKALAANTEALTATTRASESAEVRKELEKAQKRLQEARSQLAREQRVLVAPRQYGLATDPLSRMKEERLREMSAAGDIFSPKSQNGGATYYISGVERGGAYRINGGSLSLRQALSSAGLPKDAASVTLRHDGEETATVLMVPDIMKGTVDANVQPGDAIMVISHPGPKAAATAQAEKKPDFYYVGGDVPRTGAYKPTKSTDALRAIIAAGGDPVALADRHVKITPGGTGGNAAETTVKELVDGKPLPIKAGDTIMVLPSNAPKLTADPATSTPASR